MHEKQSVVTFVVERVVAIFVKNTPWPHSATKIVRGHIHERETFSGHIRGGKSSGQIVKEKKTLWPHAATKVVCGHIGEGKIFRASFRERNKFP